LPVEDELARFRVHLIADDAVLEIRGNPSRKLKSGGCALRIAASIRSRGAVQSMVRSEDAVSDLWVIVPPSAAE
jgi:hypothetical protein